jgi:hypothetical protein
VGNSARQIKTRQYSRLSCELHQRGHLFVEIIRAGVGVFFYLDDRERKPMPLWAR